MITDDRNNPDTVAWLDLCRYLRRLRPDLNDDEFDMLVPELIELGLQLQAEEQVRGMH